MCSTTVTRTPAAAITSAAINPPGPPPTTTAVRSPVTAKSAQGTSHASRSGAGLISGRTPEGYGRRVLVIGILLTLIGWALVVPRGAGTGSVVHRNVRMGSMFFQTRGYAE